MFDLRSVLLQICINYNLLYSFNHGTYSLVIPLFIVRRAYLICIQTSCTDPEQGRERQQHWDIGRAVATLRLQYSLPEW